MVTKLLKQRIKFALIGLVFGLALAFWGVMISGGGHFNLPVMLFVSPIGIGLLFWPLWGFLSVRFNSGLSKVLFLCTMIAHLLGLGFYMFHPDNSDGYWFQIAMEDSTFILFSGSAVVLYLAGQLFLWVRFLRDSFGGKRASVDTTFSSGAI